MGLFNPRSREEQARYVYHENARFQEILRGNKRKIGNLTTPDFWSDVTCFGSAKAMNIAASTTPTAPNIFLAGFVFSKALLRKNGVLYHIFIFPL